MPYVITAPEGFDPTESQDRNRLRQRGCLNGFLPRDPQRLVNGTRLECARLW